MRARYQPAELEIILDESRIARAIIDSYSVRVAVGWRVPEATPPILATLGNLPASRFALVLKECERIRGLIAREEAAFSNGEHDDGIPVVAAPPEQQPSVFTRATDA
jgi:hypothetical protein